MMKRAHAFLLAVAISPVVVWPALADVPQLLNYQGRLSDPSGNPKNGTFTMQFAVYDAETGGNQLPSGTPWNETQSVTVTNGVFNVLLGSVTALPTGLFQGGPADASGPLRFLQVTVDGEALAPRRRIVSAAYAVTAGADSSNEWVFVQTLTLSGYAVTSDPLPTDSNLFKLVLDDAFFGYESPMCGGGRLGFNNESGARYRYRVVTDNSVLSLYGASDGIPLGACHAFGTVLFDRTSDIKGNIEVAPNLGGSWTDNLISGGYASGGSAVTSFQIKGGYGASTMSGKVHVFKLSRQ